MINQSFKPDKLWYRSLLEARTELASVVTGMMLMELYDLLKEASQRSGNYVANFRVTVDGVGGGYDQMPYRPRKEWWYAGCTEAIEVALANNRWVKGEAAAAGSFDHVPIVALENETEYTEYAEIADRQILGYEGDPGNPTGPGALERFKERMYGHTSRRIYVGRGTWQYYRDYTI